MSGNVRGAALRVVSQEVYYRYRSEIGEICPLCAHATGIGWGSIEYCPKCGWNTITGCPDTSGPLAERSKP